MRIECGVGIPACRQAGNADGYSPPINGGATKIKKKGGAMTSLFKRIDMVMELSLRVLRPSPRSSSPVFLPLFDPGITGEKSRLFQNIFKIGIELEQGF
jgi:hypothetical protein